MGIPVSETKRRPWSESDKRRLIGYWDSIGSVVLISIILNRPEGSVQTEASRLNLPRRSEERGRHRKKWTPIETQGLLKAMEDCRDKDGKIHIIEVANKTGRSIDAVISRLAEHIGSREEMINSIVTTEAEIIAFANRESRFTATPVAPEQGTPTTRIDTRNIAKMRTCLTCQKPFWSLGASNRICPKCKSNDYSDWD